MNDTHNSEPTDPGTPPTPSEGDPIDGIAAADPADAPPLAERYAMDLAVELEESGAAAPDPVQLQADLDTPADPDRP
ncbi:MAG: hypothetical protein GY926_26795 [bacterium]|nr:hypothetical protein [bacterium]MCP4968823.1 hypothetical protein [bacterium]